MHFLRGGKIDGTVNTDDASERRDWVAFESAFVCFGQSLACSRTARVGVLDDGDDRLIKFLGEIPCSLQVDDVVVGEFLALELAGVG